ncbi:MAG: PKD domain-containing protein, partial [Candidatus Thermoplasmatota archaeon]|nr:PKD domain-containing protein [Candidatus Thermoplasmatota archaeon]
AEGSIVAYEWFIDDNLNSTDANITWQANQSGSYVVKLIVTDDGGLRSEVSKTVQTETVDIPEQKNFLVSFSSKNIDVGGTFTLDFTGTTGEVDYYEVTVYYPDGSNEVHSEYVKDTATYKLDKEGQHVFDIVVRWADGSSYDSNTDFYSTKVNVGNVDDTSSEQQDSETVEVDEGLPSLSFSGVLFSITILALLRRQR